MHLRLILVLTVVVALAVACANSEGDSVGMGLECKQGKPLEKHDYYLGGDWPGDLLTYYEAAQICRDCPSWPWQEDSYECAQRALGKFNR